MGVFNFKRFAVVNERSAMKVNTDGVLLGAAMSIKPGDRTMLDVGTGTGTIALMAAQRWAERHHELDSGSVGGEIPNQVWNDVRGVWNDVEGTPDGTRRGGLQIDAIDIDEASALEAGMNFGRSPWAGNLRAYHCSLDEFASRLVGAAASATAIDTTAGILTAPDRRYDLIFSNPPYFEDSLEAPDERRCNARHTKGLSYRELIEFSAERLTETGRFSIVLPADQEAPLTRYARMNGLHLFRILRIRTVPRKAPNRIIAEFSRQRCREAQEELLTIQDEGKYTEEYLSLTRDFYLFA